MKPAPQKGNLVPRPVPPIKDKSDGDIAEERVGQKSKSTQVPKRKLGKPAIPGRRREIGDRGLRDIEEYGARIPTANAFEVTSRCQSLYNKHRQSERHNNESALHLVSLFRQS